MTYSKVKTAFQIAPGEKLCLVIAVGYGTTQGAGHPVKQPEEVSKADSPVPVSYTHLDVYKRQIIRRPSR